MRLRYAVLTEELERRRREATALDLDVAVLDLLVQSRDRLVERVFDEEAFDEYLLVLA